MKTLTVSVYGAYSVADCVPMATAKNKLRIKNIAADTHGKKLLKRAVAAYNRGESTLVTECGGEMPFTVKDGASGLF